MWWHELRCVAIKMETSDLEEKLSWLMEWNGWSASFHLSQLDWHLIEIRDSAGRRGSEASPWYCAKCRKWSNNMTRALEWVQQSAEKVSKHKTVAKYKLDDALAMLNSITVYIKHGPRGWCEGRLCVLDLPTQVQATFPVKIWVEKGQ